MKNLLLASLAVCASLAHAQTTLGSLTFNDNQFGDTVTASDGGSHAAGNWLNTTAADPGVPGILTGAHFETGVANMFNGLSYTIGYNTPIANIAGDDLAIVVARYDTSDIDFALSKDGSTFGADNTAAGADFMDSGESRSYFYGTPNNGPFDADLYYYLIDLSDYGFAANETLNAVRITDTTGDSDLIRVAGVPEPTTMTLLGLGALVALRKRKKA